MLGEPFERVVDVNVAERIGCAGTRRLRFPPAQSSPPVSGSFPLAFLLGVEAEVLQRDSLPSAALATAFSTASPTQSSRNTTSRSSRVLSRPATGRRDSSGLRAPAGLQMRHEHAALGAALEHLPDGGHGRHDPLRVGDFGGALAHGHVEIHAHEHALRLQQAACGHVVDGEAGEVAALLGRTRSRRRETCARIVRADDDMCGRMLRPSSEVYKSTKIILRPCVDDARERETKTESMLVYHRQCGFYDFHGLPFSAPLIPHAPRLAGEYGTVMYEAGPPEKHECGGSRARGVERVGARGEEEEATLLMTAFLAAAQRSLAGGRGALGSGGCAWGATAENQKKGLYCCTVLCILISWARGCDVDMSKTHYINILILYEYAICDLRHSGKHCALLRYIPLREFNCSIRHRTFIYWRFSAPPSSLPTFDAREVRGGMRSPHTLRRWADPRPRAPDVPLALLAALLPRHTFVHPVPVGPRFRATPGSHAHTHRRT